MAARWPQSFFLLPLLQENYWLDLHQTLHTSSPCGLVVQRTFSSHLHIQYGRKVAILFLNIKSCYRYSKKTTGNRSSSNLHTAYPYGLVVPRTFLSHLHIQYGRQVAFLSFFLLLLVPGKLLVRSSSNLTHIIPLWSSCAAYVLASFAYSIWPPGGQVIFEVNILVIAIQRQVAHEFSPNFTHIIPVWSSCAACTFSSHLHIQYGRQVAILFILLLLFQGELLIPISFKLYTHHPPWSSCAAYVFV